MENSKNKNHTPSPRIAVIGLGYVGLPLARLFATKYPVVGFDVKSERVKELNIGHDSTLEVEDDILQSVLIEQSPFTTVAEGDSATERSRSTGLFCSSDLEDIREANIYIVTVPTPIDKNHQPVLTPLLKASESIGKVLSPGDIVVYESTVFPGATEEECVPVLEKYSGMRFNKDFYVGYSPERINPGDKKHTVDQILKVVSGSTSEIGEKLNALYGEVIEAGTHLAPTIKVAEAAKVIENSQRDINIAFVNELAKIFNKLHIDTQDVLEAAGTKWNFLPFQPGLVGGHCIGVDPYYLAQKAQQIGYHPEIILGGRRLNDSMGGHVASEVVKLMLKKDLKIKSSKVLVLGFTFKENCPDVRNTRVIDVVNHLKEYEVDVDIYDPWANPQEVEAEYGVKTTQTCPDRKYEAIVLTVAHRQFLDLDFSHLKEGNAVVYDVKSVLGKAVDGKL